MLLNLSCPAVSQMFSFKVIVRKSKNLLRNVAPRVGTPADENLSDTKRSIMQDFPTRASPRKITFACWKLDEGEFIFIKDKKFFSLGWKIGLYLFLAILD